jgi:hypothetical protein
MPGFWNQQGDNMKKTVAASALLLLLLASAGAANPGHCPTEVQNAEKTTANWMRTLVGRSEKEIVNELGAPAERATWDLQGNKWPKLTYRLSPTTSVQLFFNGEKLSTISYLIIL